MTGWREDPEVSELLGRPSLGLATPALDAVLPSGAGTPMAVVGGAYDGASRFDSSLALWSPPMNSADDDILPSKMLIDSRVRDTLRNDSYVLSGSNIHKDNIVGSMFLLNSKPEYRALGLDETWAEEFQEEVESKFMLWAESPRNWPDASRMNNLTSLVRLAVGVYTMSGEVLATVEWLRDSDRPYSTAIQMVDLDRLSNPNGLADTKTLRGGVEKDRRGRPIAYHIRMAHPNDWTDLQNNYWKRVPVAKPWGRAQVIHILEQFRPDQTRGVSEIVSALKELRITKKFRDIVLQNAVVNATYAASIESDMPSETVFQALGGGNMGENVGVAIEQYASGYLGAIAQYAGSSKHMAIDGVKIPHLFPGTRLQLRPAGQGGPLGTEFEQSLLRYIAANLGVSYEQLSRDYSQSNYSSIRAAMTETWKYMQGRKRMVADRFASQVYMLWLEEAINAGEITTFPRRGPNWYEGLNAEAYSACEWIGASRGQIDELKETQAATLRLKYHLSTYEDEMARLGKDWRKALVQREREMREFKERGLLVEDDEGMSNAITGESREKTAEPSEATDEE
jgi:lambda family phage portal protein